MSLTWHAVQLCTPCAAGSGARCESAHCSMFGVISVGLPLSTRGELAEQEGRAAQWRWLDAGIAKSPRAAA